MDQTVEVLIDLGEERSVRDSRSPRTPGWRALAAALALVALALPGGAAVAPRAALVALASVPASGSIAFVSTDLDLYVATNDTNEQGAATVAAYTLPGGHPRWRVRLAEAPEVPALDWFPAAGVLLAAEHADVVARVIALDGGTGRTLWSRRDAVVLDAAPGDRVLLRWRELAGTYWVGWFDVRTGQAVWSGAVPEWATVVVARAPGQPAGALLVIGEDSTALLLGEQDGAVLVQGRLLPAGGTPSATGESGGTAAPDERPAVQVAGGLILAEYPSGTDSGRLAAFDLHTLAWRWSLDADLRGEPFHCGALLCLDTAAGVLAVDAGTGVVRWGGGDRWQYATPLDGSRVLAYSAANGIDVLDAGTGALLWRIGPRWTGVTGTGGSGPGPVALLTRRDRRAADRYWFAPLTRDARPFGYVEGIDWRSCAVYGDVLACQTPAGRLRVWRYPSHVRQSD